MLNTWQVDTIKVDGDGRHCTSTKTLRPQHFSIDLKNLINLLYDFKNPSGHPVGAKIEPRFFKKNIFRTRNLIESYNDL